MNAWYFIESYVTEIKLMFENLLHLKIIYTVDNVSNTSIGS